MEPIINNSSIVPVVKEHVSYHGDNNKGSTKSTIVNASFLADALLKTNQGIMRNVPDEVISEIMKHLSPCFAASFGLTCSKIYSEFKFQHSKPIKLETLLWDTEGESVDPADREKKLHHLIGGWINKDRLYFYHDMYLAPCWEEALGDARPSTSDYITQSRQCVGGRFLLTELYAPSSFARPHPSRLRPIIEAPQKNLTRLREAYNIYTAIVQEVEDLYPRLLPSHEFAVPIPSPCNMGDDWFPEFFNALVSDWYLSQAAIIFFGGEAYIISSNKKKGNEQVRTLMTFAEKNGVEDRFGLGQLQEIFRIEDFIARVFAGYEYKSSKQSKLSRSSEDEKIEDLL